MRIQGNVPGKVKDFLPGDTVYFAGHLFLLGTPFRDDQTRFNALRLHDGQHCLLCDEAVVMKVDGYFVATPDYAWQHDRET